MRSYIIIYIYIYIYIYVYIYIFFFFLINKSLVIKAPVKRQIFFIHDNI